jgi:NADH dehydrogenase
MELPPLHNQQKRVVIAGAGFAGIRLAKKLSSKFFQVVLLDKNNYHQFQPLLYQVATSGLEPSSISFPLRKIFQEHPNVFIRIAEVLSIDAAAKSVHTSVGDVTYDYLVLAYGAVTNFFGQASLQQYSFSMKSVEEALLLRNTLLRQLEEALTVSTEAERMALLNIVVVGGGPTGVELAGALAEMKSTILPRDYPELNFEQMRIYLLEASPRLLGAMSDASGEKVVQYLTNLGVDVLTGTAVKDFDGQVISLSTGTNLHSKCLIWAAGIKGSALPGIPATAFAPNERILVNEFNEVKEMTDVYALGDIAMMQTADYQRGHPQVAPAAIQQAGLLAKNLKNKLDGKPLKPFVYNDKGSMATVGKNLAVVEVGNIKFGGFLAYLDGSALNVYCRGKKQVIHFPELGLALFYTRPFVAVNYKAN